MDGGKCENVTLVSKRVCVSSHFWRLATSACLDRAKDSWGNVQSLATFWTVYPNVPGGEIKLSTSAWICFSSTSTLTLLPTFKAMCFLPGFFRITEICTVNRSTEIRAVLDLREPHSTDMNPGEHPDRPDNLQSLHTWLAPKAAPLV